MEIKAVKLYENGFMTEGFAFGGSDGADSLDSSKTYASSLQNYLIDTGKEVILIDTGIPSSVPNTPPSPGQKIYQGSLIKHYLAALNDLGYSKEQVSKILLTHKHPDHSGELKSFPSAKIYASKAEAEALNLDGDNVVKAQFNDGPYHNFSASEKIAEGIYLIPAPGHTLGNSIVIAEDNGIFYMLHGDVTYTDAALINNKLSVVFEDKEKAISTLNDVREFIRKQSYCISFNSYTRSNYKFKREKDHETLDDTIIIQTEKTMTYLLKCQ